METTQPAVAVTAERSLSPAWRSVLIVAGVIVLAIVLIVGIRFLAYAMTHETTEDAQIDADQVDVTSKIAERVDRILVDTNQQVKRGDLLIQLDDRDERARLLQARANRDAVIAQARAASANVTLTRDMQAAQNEQNAGAIDQARAAVRGAAANTESSAQQIAVAQAGVAAASAQLQAANDAVPGARQNMLKTQADLGRMQSLLRTGDVSQQQADAARAAYEAARSSYAQSQAMVQAASAELNSAQQKLAAQRFATSGTQATIGQQLGGLAAAQGRLAESSSPSRISAQQAQADAASAQIGAALSQVRVAQDQLSYTQIRSPIDGYVGAKNVEAGKTVAPGESLMTVVPAARIYITANYKETQLGKLHAGQTVDINVDAYKGVKFTGHVQAISPASQSKFSLVPAQNATGNFVKVTQRVPVRIVFDKPDPAYVLRPGMSVETSVKVK
jgi:membrane fusion protein (multidrug efflux system)